MARNNLESGDVMTRAMIFDTELSDRKNGEIIQASWMRFVEVAGVFGPTDLIPPGLDNIEHYTEYFKPAGSISHGAMAVHHILPSELKRCRASSEFAIPLDVDFIIGHSIDEDWKAAGSPLHVKRIDTHCIAQWLWPEATGYSQGALLYMIAGERDSTRSMLKRCHDATWDVRINLCILEEILRLNPGIATWSQLWNYSEECRIPRTCPLKRWEGVLLADMDYDAITWCLGQHWIDSYFRVGLERALKARAGTRAVYDYDDDDDDHESDAVSW